MMSRDTSTSIAMLAVTALPIDSKSKKKSQKKKEKDMYGDVIEVEIVQERTSRPPSQVRAISSGRPPLPKLALESVLNYLESTGKLTGEHRERLLSDIKTLRAGLHAIQERRIIDV